MLMRLMSTMLRKYEIAMGQPRAVTPGEGIPWDSGASVWDSGASVWSS